MQTTNGDYEGIWVLKVKVISLPYIFQVLYVLCFTNAKISGERLQDHWSSGLGLKVHLRQMSKCNTLHIFSSPEPKAHW